MGDSITFNDPKIILIGGTGRSGTNISKAILANHPQVAVLPFEYRFIVDPDGIVDFYRGYAATWSPFLADRRLKRLENLLNILAEEPLWHKLMGSLLRTINRDGKILAPRRYHGWNLDVHLPNFKQHTQDLMTKLIDFSFSACWVGTESYTFRPQVYHSAPKSNEELARILGDFIRAVVNDFLTQCNKTFYVEDNTWNILFARELLELIPKAKILHIYRDPRDVVASFIQQRWCPSDKAQAALWYKSIITHWLKIKADLPPDSYYEYSLESLVNSTDAVLKEICHFTGIPYDPILLKIDLSKAHLERWRKEFDLMEQQVIQDILKDVIGELGYRLG